MRRRGRECALQILYQLDVGKDLDAAPAGTRVEQAMHDFWLSFEAVDGEDKEFAERLVRGVTQRLLEVDKALGGVSQHWRLDRMDKVDKNLLRLAAYEILHCPDIPRAASINEAIEIAKRFSGRDSAAFVNGILDQLGRDRDGDARDEAKDVGVDST
jgi:N utilization substance protein B